MARSGLEGGVSTLSVTGGGTWRAPSSVRIGLAAVGGGEAEGLGESLGTARAARRC